MIVRLVALMILMALGCAPLAARPAWELPLLDPVQSKPIHELLDTGRWEISGAGAGVSITPSSTEAGKKDLRFEFHIDQRDEGPYPAGWPSIQTRIEPAWDWSEYDGIQCVASAQSSVPGLAIPFYVTAPGSGLFAPFCLKAGETREFTVSFAEANASSLNKISLFHLFVSECEYPDDATVTITFRDFRLVKLSEKGVSLPAEQAGVELFVGEAAEAVILPCGSASVSGKTVAHAGSSCPLKPTDRLTYTATELFTGKKLRYTTMLGREVAGGEIVEIPFTLPIGKLKARPGYYWLVCDLVRGRKSLVGGRVGFEDFYLQQPGESMAHTVLSLRMGMGLYIIDPIGGYGRGHVSFMHAYDPRDSAHYLDFIRAYKGSTLKHTEGLEAGVTGTVFAATAFRRLGEMDRARFAERLLKSNCDYMINHMQDPDGGVETIVNVYYDRNIGAYKDSPSYKGYRDTNQIGEWLRPIARTILYLRDVPGQEKYADKLYKAARKAADYLVRVSVDQVGDRKHVIRSFGLAGYGPNPTRSLYYQEGRYCDVYAPRAMAGLSYFAYVRQLREGNVPQSYLDALRDTTEWAMEKMKPDTGWFDWQCGYEVESGCHAILGNLYLGEAAQGYYLLCASRKDTGSAQLAAECVRRALRFITDYERNVSKNPPIELWGGPYIYWQFSEYLGSIGEDQALRNYICALHRMWSVDRKWKDFLQRGGDGIAFRADDLSHLTMSALAYPALKVLEEAGKPFRYETLDMQPSSKSR